MSDGKRFRTMEERVIDLETRIELQQVVINIHTDAQRAMTDIIGMLLKERNDAKAASVVQDRGSDNVHQPLAQRNAVPQPRGPAWDGSPHTDEY